MSRWAAPYSVIALGLLSGCLDQSNRAYEDFVPKEIVISGVIASETRYGVCSIEIFNIDKSTIDILRAGGLEALDGASRSRVDPGDRVVVYENWKSGPMYGAVDQLSLRERQALRTIECLADYSDYQFNFESRGNDYYYTFSKERPGVNFGDTLLVIIPDKRVIVVSPH